MDRGNIRRVEQLIPDHLGENVSHPDGNIQFPDPGKVDMGKVGHLGTSLYPKRLTCDLIHFEQVIGATCHPRDHHRRRCIWV